MERSEFKKTLDFTEFSVLKDMDFLDKKIENVIKLKNESEIEFEIKNELTDLYPQSGIDEFDEIDYEMFKQSLEKQKFHNQFHEYMKREENLNRSKMRNRFFISEGIKEDEYGLKEEKDIEKSKEEFVPWILVFVGTLIGISVIKRALTE